jgi:serine/threonine protein kinase
VHFPHLEILGLLGQGGMGAVYQVRQRKLDRFVALKILPTEASRDTAFAERFTREARGLARLNHGNLVTVHDFGDVDGLYYFLMEFVDGADLRQRLRAGHPPGAEALAIAGQICDALQFAHDQGIVHRDIKPENILLDTYGRVKIGDFGIAKLLDRKTTNYTLTGPWQIMGTLRYLAPEQMDNPLAVDHRADIYALGVVLYEMLTGQVPVGRFVPPSQQAATDPRLDAIVLRALEQHPEKRYEKASDLKADLQRVGRSVPPAVVENDRTQPLELGPRRQGKLRRAFAAIRGRLGPRSITLLGMIFWTWFVIVVVFLGVSEIAESSIWPYEGHSVNSVSLEPTSRKYKRLILTKQREMNSSGKIPSQFDNGDPSRMNRCTITLEIEMSSGASSTLEIDVLNGLAWSYLDRSGRVQGRDAPVDTIAIVQWLNDLGIPDSEELMRIDRSAGLAGAFGMSSKQVQAEALLAIIKASAGEDSISPRYSSEPRPSGRLESIVSKQEGVLFLPYPFQNHSGSRTAEIKPVLFPFIRLSIPLSLALWVAGLWFCWFWLMRRRRQSSRTQPLDN